MLPNPLCSRMNESDHRFLLTGITPLSLLNPHKRPASRHCKQPHIQRRLRRERTSLWCTKMRPQVNPSQTRNAAWNAPTKPKIDRQICIRFAPNYLQKNYLQGHTRCSCTPHCRSGHGKNGRLQKERSQRIDAGNIWVGFALWISTQNATHRSARAVEVRSLVGVTSWPQVACGTAWDRYSPCKGDVCDW